MHPPIPPELYWSYALVIYTAAAFTGLMCGFALWLVWDEYRNHE